MSISSLRSLKTLDLRSNPKLKKIPKELAALQCLETFLLDESVIIYPAATVVAQGTEAIMRFLCQGMCQFSPPGLDIGRFRIWNIGILADCSQHLAELEQNAKTSICKERGTLEI